MNKKRALEILGNYQHQVADGDAGFRPDEIRGANEDFDAFQYAIDVLENKPSKIKELKEENHKLRFMIDNGLGWEDVKNDITING